MHIACIRTHGVKFGDGGQGSVPVGINQPRHDHALPAIDHQRALNRSIDRQQCINHAVLDEYANLPVKHRAPVKQPQIGQQNGACSGLGGGNLP